MPYVCTNPEEYEGKKVGSGQCVEFVREATNAPHTGLWKRGAKAKGAIALSKGTAIATFDKDGKYANKVTGNHAAIYLNQDINGLYVDDQWVSQGAVKKRYIRFKNGEGSPSNDGDAFSVID